MLVFIIKSSTFSQPFPLTPNENHCNWLDIWFVVQIGTGIKKLYQDIPTWNILQFMIPVNLKLMVEKGES